MININKWEEALQKEARKLDISPSKYKQAMERFESIRSYLLDGGNYEYAIHDPDIYLQGSFKLGTEIRPYRNSKDADYDIDVVCCLAHQKEHTSPKIIKHQVGDHLKNNKMYAGMLGDEGKRCWTLNYAEQDGMGFHMDILPSVPDDYNDLSCDAIAVTNKLGDIYEWLPSNPQGLARWFREKNKVAFRKVESRQKQSIFERHQREQIFSNISDVPDIHVKTPLQRAIQILKRHRDIRFCHQEHEKYKPISMIITVLAARIYRNEPTIYETLQNVINTLARHTHQIQPDFHYNATMARSRYSLVTKEADDRWSISNPTNHNENFADKWHEDNQARAKAFFQWITWAKEDFIKIASRLHERHYIMYLSSFLEPPSNTSLSIDSHHALTSLNDAHQRIPWWLSKLDYIVQISAKFKAGGSRQFVPFNSNEILNKNCKLRFTANTKVPGHLKVYWQVVNTGKEAKDAIDLRGEIFPSKTAGRGGLIEPQKESTSYTGTHWIRCFIVKDGTCVACSEKFIVRIR